MYDSERETLTQKKPLVHTHKHNQITKSNWDCINLSHVVLVVLNHSFILQLNRAKWKVKCVIDEMSINEAEMVRNLLVLVCVKFVHHYDLQHFNRI